MFFQFNMKKMAAALLILLLPVILFNLEASFKLISRPFIESSYFVQSGLNWVSQGVGDTAGKYINLISVKKLNKALLTEVSNLKMQNVSYKELQLENERLKSMLELKTQSPMGLTACSVVAEDALSENQSLSISKGSKSGVQEGMGVLGLNGLVGRVLKTSSRHSQVLILSDRFFVTEGLIQRSRKKLILEGNGDDLLISKHIDKDLDIQMGDLVVTSGGELEFPKGLPIGTVTDVKETNAGITKTVYVEPLTDLLNTEELFVILDSGKEEEK